MNIKEIPLVIQCHSSSLIGILHKPQYQKKIGIIFVPAGGPQYRVGRARQLVLWSRYLSREGYPVLRFDYRGFGDSAGQFMGFEHIDNDLASAIEKMTVEIPDLDAIVLWGECNAASAIMMYAWRDPRVKALIMQNPWVRNEITQARTYIKHYYLMRVAQKSFWVKFLKFQFNPLKSLISIFVLLRRGNEAKQQGGTEDNFENLVNFQDKMREGLSRFSGKVLLFMNGDSMTGKEFDELVSVSESWQSILEKKELTRIGYTFFSLEGREQFLATAVKWLTEFEKSWHK